MIAYRILSQVLNRYYKIKWTHIISLEQVRCSHSSTQYCFQYAYAKTTALFLFLIWSNWVSSVMSHRIYYRKLFARNNKISVATQMSLQILLNAYWRQYLWLSATLLPIIQAFHNLNVLSFHCVLSYVLDLTNHCLLAVCITVFWN